MSKTSDRFWSNVDKNGGPERLRWETIKDAPGDGTPCWIWVGTKKRARHDYGIFYYGRYAAYAHRYAWELVNGPIPPKIDVCHYCDHPACVNPDHLYLGEARDYSAYTSKKGHSMAQLHPERVARGDRSGRRQHPEMYPRGDNHYSRLHPERMRQAFGEQNGQAKLTEQDVREILHLRESGMTCQKLARKFNISMATTVNICNGKLWKHITRPPFNAGSKEEFKIEKGVPNIQRHILQQRRKVTDV